jgi:hypothetical protein
MGNEFRHRFDGIYGKVYHFPAGRYGNEQIPVQTCLELKVDLLPADAFLCIPGGWLT